MTPGDVKRGVAMGSYGYSRSWAVQPLLRVEEDLPGASLVLRMAPWPRGRFLARYMIAPIFVAAFGAFPGIAAWSRFNPTAGLVAGAVGAAIGLALILQDMSRLLTGLSVSRARGEVRVESLLFDVWPRVQVLLASQVAALELKTDLALDTDPGGELQLTLTLEGAGRGAPLLQLRYLYVSDLNRLEEALDFGTRIALALGLDHYRAVAGGSPNVTYRFGRGAEAGAPLPQRRGAADYGKDRLSPGVPPLPEGRRLEGEAPALDASAWQAEGVQVRDHEPGRRLLLERREQTERMLVGYAMFLLFLLIGLVAAYSAWESGSSRILFFVVFAFASPVWLHIARTGRAATFSLDRAAGVARVDAIGVPISTIVEVELREHTWRSDPGTPGGCGYWYRFEVALLTATGKRHVLASTQGHADRGLAYRPAHALAAESGRILDRPVRERS